MEIVIHEEEEKGYRIVLSLSEFKEIFYIHLRRYYRDLDGEFIPSKEGIALPMEFNNIVRLAEGVLSVLAKAERIDLIKNILSKYEPHP